MLKFNSTTSLTISPAISVPSGAYTITNVNGAVTGVGTTFTSGMVGGLIVFSSGASASITTFNSTTSLTVIPAATVASGNYTIYFGILGSIASTSSAVVVCTDNTVDAVTSWNIITNIGLSAPPATTTLTSNATSFSFAPTFCNFISTAAVVFTVANSTAVTCETEPVGQVNTGDIIPSTNPGGGTLYTFNVAGTYDVSYGIWNTVSVSTEVYYATTTPFGGIATKIANGVISAGDNTSMTTCRFMYKFGVGDTMKILCSSNISNSAPTGTPSPITAFLAIVRLG